MELESIVNLTRQALHLAFVLGGPLLFVGALVGLIVGVLQAATQIQDQTIAFVIKLIVMLMVFALTLPWATSKTVEYTRSLFENLPESVTVTLE
ncbi:MAG: flagellar biosynthetic protein FliQ [Planctomycetia bacterium]|nr:flagellar biosynthetic protein FliQ [Planctomycetia bacterium]